MKEMTYHIKRFSHQPLDKKDPTASSVSAMTEMTYHIKRFSHQPVDKKDPTASSD